MEEIVSLWNLLLFFVNQLSGTSWCEDRIILFSVSVLQTSGTSLQQLHVSDLTRKEDDIDVYDAAQHIEARPLFIISHILSSAYLDKVIHTNHFCSLCKYVFTIENLADERCSLPWKLKSH